MKDDNSIIYKFITALVLIVFGFGFLLNPNKSYSAQISQSSDDLSQLEAGGYADHEISFIAPSGAEDISDTIILTFPLGFDLSMITVADCAFLHGASTGEEISETVSPAPTSTDWGIQFSGQSITLTHPSTDESGDIAPNDILILKIGKNVIGGNNQIKNGLSGNYTLNVSGSFGDTGQIPIIILEDDQIYAQMDVVPRISLTLSSNQSSFGQINESKIGTIVTSTPDLTLTISTNHSNGYAVYVYDQGNGTYPGIYNSSLNILLGSATSNYDNNINLDATIAGYGIQAECLAGCNTNNEITERFRVTGNTIGGLEKTPGIKFIEYGTYLEEEHIVKVRHKIKVSEYTRTGDYIDNITYAATARY